MAPNPNQIDISLALLPGESEAVIQNLIEQLQTISAQMAAIMGGDEYAPVGGVMARKGITASTHGVDPVNVNIVGFGANDVTTVPVASASRTRAKLEAAAGIPDVASEVVDNASVPPEPDGGPMPDEPIRDAEERSRRQQVIDQAREKLVPRRPPTEEQEAAGETGDFDWGEAARRARDIAVTTSAFRNPTVNVQGAVADEAMQLKSSFRSSNIENLGTELGGTNAPAVGAGGIGGQIPGMPLVQAIRGLLGNDGAQQSAGYKGLRAEIDSLWQGFKDPYLTQSEARQITHDSAGRGWDKDVAERTRDNFSRLRRGTPGLRQMDTGIYGQAVEQTLRGGGSSIEDLNRALKAMPEAAEAAHMGINEYIKSATDYAEGLTKAGASFGRAAMAAPAWTAATGMAPQVASAVRESPMVQGQLYAQGFTPATSGLASSGNVAKATSSSIKELYDIYSQGGYQDITEKTAAGTHTVTADEQIRAEIGNEFGINADTVEKFLAQQGRTGAAADASTDIDEYSKRATEIEDRLRGNDKGLSEARRWMRTGEGAPDEAVTRPEVMKQLEAAGVNRDDLATVARNKDATGFADAARKALSKTTAGLNDASTDPNETINDRIAVSVELTMKGELSKYIKDQRIETDTYRNAKKTTNAGDGNFNHNNPRAKPPATSWIDTITDLNNLPPRKP